MLLVGGELTYEVRSVSQVKTGFLHLGCPYCCEISLRVFLHGAAQSDLGGREGGSCSIRLGFPDCAGKRGEILSFCCPADGTAASAAPQPRRQQPGGNSPTWSKPLRMFFLRKLLGARAGWRLGQQR